MVDGSIQYAQRYAASEKNFYRSEMFRIILQQLVMINVFMNLLDLTLAEHALSMRLGLMYVYMDLLLLYF